MTKRNGIITAAIALLAGAVFVFAPSKTYYVSPTGNDANAGTQTAPFLTIQKCLDVVKAGEACEVQAGIYSIITSLKLKTTGTASAPISLTCKGVVNINSGNARTLETVGAINYYIIDGCRFTSSLIDNSHPSKMGTVNFAYNFWGDGAEKERGNDGFILRNCYVEGSVYIYGSGNLVENCELNGKGLQTNGLIFAYAPSDNNIARNNVIHDYPQRGGWVLQYGVNNLFTGNIIYNTGSVAMGGEGIDCDGAGSAVYKCDLINNTIYNMRGEIAILLENCFDCVISGNIIHDVTAGIGVINYNINNSPDTFKSDKDYKGLVTNTVISNNVLYNIGKKAVSCTAVRGNQFINNTVHNVTGSAIVWERYSGVFCLDWIVAGNIVSTSPKTIFLDNPNPFVMDNNFYSGVFAVEVYQNGNRTFSQWQAMGKDINSKTGNPQFVNAAAGDFHLQPGSPACGYGAYICSVVIVTPSLTPTVTNTATLLPSFTSSATNTATPTKTAMPPTFTMTAHPCYSVVIGGTQFPDFCP